MILRLNIFEGLSQCTASLQLGEIHQGCSTWTTGDRCTAFLQLGEIHQRCSTWTTGDLARAETCSKCIGQELGYFETLEQVAAVLNPRKDTYLPGGASTFEALRFVFQFLSI